MQIINVTKNLKFNAELADNIFSHAKGLSFSNKKRNMIFTFLLAGKKDLWMFGMSYDLWIAFIDERKRVFDVVKARKMTLNPKTWKIYKPKQACKYVLESPKKIVNVGDKLKF